MLAVVRSKCWTQKWVISRKMRNVPVIRCANHWNALERAVRPYLLAMEVRVRGSGFRVR